MEEELTLTLKRGPLYRTSGVVYLLVSCGQAIAHQATSEFISKYEGKRVILNFERENQKAIREYIKRHL